MRLGDIYMQIRGRIARAISILRFNPLTEEGRRYIMNELMYQGIKRGREVEVPNPFNNSQSENNNNNNNNNNNPQSENRPSQYQNNTPQPQNRPSQYQNNNPQPQANRSPSQPVIIDRSPEAARFTPPPPTPTPQPPNLSGTTAATDVVSPYPEYRCVSNDPLFCYQLQETLQAAPQAKFCSKCSFPVPLLEKQQIRGHRGIYQIKKLIGKRGRGRLYSAIEQNENKPVEIKEYLLPNRSFSGPEIVKQRQEAFIRIANIRSADGKTSDFRLLFPKEGIADRQQKRCYLIFKGNLGTLPTLKDYLAQKGAIDAELAVSLLDQILQSLEYLHGTKFQYQTGQIQQGLIHGNISTDSILVAFKGRNFFAYLCDFSFWEELFEANRSQMDRKTVAEDLRNLGMVGFYALAGRSTDPRFGQPLDPQNAQHWPAVDRNLKNFILKLLGIHYPFNSAKTAREELRELSVKVSDRSNILTEEREEDRQQQKKKPWKSIIAVSALVLVLATLGWVISSLTRKQEPVVDRSKELVPEITDIPEVPPGDFTFTTVRSGVTSYAFLTKLLQAKTRNIIDEIEVRNPQLSLNHLPSRDKEEAIAKINPDRTQFAIVSSFDGIAGKNLDGQTVAYNGILVFVPYTSEKRPNSIVAPLEGQITIEDLRALYTGKIKNWQKLGGPDLEVELFVPDAPEAIRIFEELILKDEKDLALFRSLLKQGEIKQLRTLEIIRNIYRDFETRERVGGIGFGFINQVFDQCSVYPLALAQGDNPPVQTLIQSNNTDQKQPITPKTNLCSKAGYRVDEEVFQNQRYPLAFSINVLYADDNREEPKYQIGKKFAKMLKTEEGQCLLKDVFLVPLQPLNDCTKYKNN